MFGFVVEDGCWIRPLTADGLKLLTTDLSIFFVISRTYVPTTRTLCILTSISVVLTTKFFIRALKPLVPVYFMALVVAIK